MTAALRPAPAFLGAVGTSALGDGVRFAALPLIALANGASAAEVSLLFVAGTLPWLLVAVPAGEVVDRVPVIPLCIALDVLRVPLSVALALSADDLGWAVLAAASAVFGAAEVVTEIATTAAVPRLDSPVEPTFARLSTLQTGGRELAGPLLGAVLVTQGGAQAALLLDAVTFALSALLLARVGRLRAAVPAGAGRRPGYRSALRVLTAHRVLLVLALTATLLNVAYMAMTAVLAAYVTDDLRLDGSVYGLTLAALSAAGVVVGLLLSRRRRPVTAGRAAAAAATCAAGLVLVATATGAVLLLGGCLLLGAGVMLWNVASVSLRQRLCPDHLRGRVEALYRLAAWGALPLGSALGGLAARGGDSRAGTWLGAGVAVAATAVAAALLPRMQVPAAEPP